MIAPADRVVVIEANPRASRTVPIVAKATGRDVVADAVRCALGATLAEVGLQPGLPDAPLVAVKAPIGSLWRLPAWIGGWARDALHRRGAGPGPDHATALEAARRGRGGPPGGRRSGERPRGLTAAEERPSRLRYGGSRTATVPSSRRQANSRTVRRDGPWLSPPARASIGDGPDPVGAGQPIGSPTPSPLDEQVACRIRRASGGAGVPGATWRGDRHPPPQVAAVPADHRAQRPCSCRTWLMVIAVNALPKFAFGGPGRSARPGWWPGSGYRRRWRRGRTATAAASRSSRPPRRRTRSPAGRRSRSALVRRRALELCP